MYVGGKLKVTSRERLSECSRRAVCCNIQGCIRSAGGPGINEFDTQACLRGGGGYAAFQVDAQHATQSPV